MRFNPKDKKSFCQKISVPGTLFGGHVGGRAEDGRL